MPKKLQLSQKIGTLVFGEKMSWNIVIGIVLSIFAICFMILCPGRKK